MPALPSSGSAGTPRLAWRERAAQNLLYRTEYLATVVSEAADVQAPHGEELRRALVSSQAPKLVSAAVALLSRKQAEELVSPSPLSLPPASPRRPAIGRLGPKVALQRRPFEIEAVDRDGLSAKELQARIAWEETCGSVQRMIDTLPQPVNVDTAKWRLNTLKVKPVPGIPEGAFSEDHLDTNEALWWRQVELCGHVEHLAEDPKDFPVGAAAAARRFARFLWCRQEEGVTQALPSRFLRLDGGDEFSTAKFSLIEGCTALVRQEGFDPFHSHALVTCDVPVQVSSAGHYFEVRVRSVFRSPGRADRPRHHTPRGRTEGLVLGLTTTRLAELPAAAVPTATSVPSAWCVCTAGTFYSTGPCIAEGRPARPFSQEPLQPPRPWHRGAPPKPEQLRCTWPPPLVPGSVRRRLRWSLGVAEGDAVGLLVTPFGGLAVVVNGERHLMVPDAGVPTDVPLYPLVEAYNHVRSLQMAPGAPPPG